MGIRSVSFICFILVMLMVLTERFRRSVIKVSSQMGSLSPSVISLFVARTRFYI